MAKRNSMNDTDFNVSETGMPICPIITPTIRVEVTGPREKDLIFSSPIQKPSPIVRKIGITGLDLNISAMKS